MFECRVEPKHDLNLSVRWYRNDEELVGLIDNDECTEDERITQHLRLLVQKLPKKTGRP